jgi:transposase
LEPASARASPQYTRLQGRQRRYIKGQKYTLLSRRENLTLDGKKALKTLLAANKRLNTAYVLKESFGQLWRYERERRGTALLRAMAREPQVAAPQALREIRRDD